MRRALEFGIFDWLEYQPGTPLGDTFEDRLRMLELADEPGFYAYHLAHHEGTPLSVEWIAGGGDCLCYLVHPARASGAHHILPAESMRLLASEVMPAVSLKQEVVSR